MAFKPGPVDSYQHKVALDGVAIAMDPYDDPEKAKLAFGKVYPPQHGVMPVLIVLENRRKTPIDARRIRVLYKAPGEREIEMTTAYDLRAAGGPTKPKITGAPIPVPLPTRSKKNPLAAPEFEERAFAANMIAPGESASGFVYFLTEYHGQVTVTVAGLRDAKLGQDLFFFEVPLSHR